MFFNDLFTFNSSSLLNKLSTELILGFIFIFFRWIEPKNRGLDKFLIELARLFEESKVDERVMILLTDGNDTGSKMPPLKAAEIAEQNGIIIHTIGIGDPNANGENKVDLGVIKRIANSTGGKSFRGEDTKGLQGIYKTLDELNPQNFESRSYRPKHPLFFYPIGLAISLLTVYHFIMFMLVFLKRISSKNKDVTEGTV